MKKTLIIVISLLIVTGLIFGGINLLNKSSKPTIAYETVEDMKAVINAMYEKYENPLASLETNEIDISDEMRLASFTGLQSNKDVEKVVVSEPMMTSQAYSLVLVKVAKDADVEAIKKEMVDNIDTRKWLCVSAESLYATNHNELICLVMSSEELAKPTYEAFKEVVGNKIGKELEKSEVIEMPEDMGY